MRGLIRPMLATLVSVPFHRPGWVYEEKYDGERVIAYRRGGRVRLVSRSLKDVTPEFPDIGWTLEHLPDGDVVLDGEVVAFDEHGISRFQLLQRRAMGEAIHPVFVAFDCLERDGTSLLDRPLAERRRALEAIAPGGRGVVRLARRVRGDGLAAYRTARAKGWEGIIAKDAASRYEPGRRSGSWLKVKVRRESEFVIGGFTAPSGKRRHFGALLVGLYDGGRLRFTGKIGTGYSERTLADLAARTRPLRTSTSPFERPPAERDVTWVRPQLVAQVAFAEWTRDGKLRQPAFLGLRRDKKPSECTWQNREA